ncbi:MAG: bifunctional UDP-N-acetylglucosamine diphosphorylase/glucosamine-1-phosphate N-acetyltransferase GlmU [Anaeroplasmataceae bacterium]|nr:bifunctional UDP-N-acetylglucosamine diphosphorylase/glucosamine-1-phosphate N-acetyltransferase GlmU [Anaeroplasmataceae bacterium]
MVYAMILAAGKGTRMHSPIAKCKQQILGKSMIDYIYDNIHKTSISKTIFVLGEDANQFDPPSDVLIAHQDLPLGTAYAVRCGLQRVTEEQALVLILPGDAPFLDEKILEGIIEEHKKKNNALTIATIRLDSPYGYGRVIRNQEGIQKIVEEKDATPEEALIQDVYCGVMCASTNILKMYLPQIKNDNAAEEFYLTDLVQLVAEECHVGSYEIVDTFKAKGINTLLDLADAEKECQRRILEKHMLAGVKMEKADSITIGPDVTFLGSAIIRQGSILLGKTIVHSNVSIGPYSEISDSVLLPGCKIAHSVLESAVVGEETVVGPYAHIRSGTKLGKKNRVGNFVEVKNSVLGENTKASHLTYIGDTTCGNHVNWGCGSITVNYDGKSKYKTIVGDNTFIGCNTNLIAPITIGERCFIAAGSTITDSLKSDDFAVGRTHQITKKKYASKYIQNKEDKI